MKLGRFGQPFELFLDDRLSGSRVIFRRHNESTSCGNGVNKNGNNNIGVK